MINFRSKENSDTRISSCDIVATMALQKNHLSSFIHCVSTNPDLQVFAGLNQAFKIANRIFHHSSKTSIHKQLICYDTTFNVGNYYLSTILIKNVELGDEPMFPVAFFIHDRKKMDDHRAFLKFVFNRLQVNQNIPVVTDRERAITNVFLEMPETKNNHFCCFNHIISDAKLKANSLMDSKEAQFCINDMYKLLKAKTLQNYSDLKKELEQSWGQVFGNYFNTNLHPALEKNFQQLDTKRYSVFVKGDENLLIQQKPDGKTNETKDLTITNNLSESFHSALKRVFDKGMLQRTEHVLISLYMYQVHCIQEFDRAIAETGEFYLKPQFKHLATPSGIPFARLDFDTLLKDAKEKIVVFDPKTIKSRDDNWVERQLAIFVIKADKIRFSDERNCFVVSHPFVENQPQIVLQPENGVFICKCREKTKVDCFHIIAAKIKSNHEDKISCDQQLPKLSLVQRTYTREKKGGKKKPRLLDLDINLDTDVSINFNNNLDHVLDNHSLSTENFGEKLLYKMILYDIKALKLFY